MRSSLSYLYALSRERFDALFITVYPVYPALLGPRLKAEFHVPFVLDYQDPWVGAWGQSVGGGPGGAPDWKSRASRRLGEWLEPRAVAMADALVAVSQGTLDGIVERTPAAGRVPHGVIPLGLSRPISNPFAPSQRQSHFDPSDGLVHLCYGTLLKRGEDTWRCCWGLARPGRRIPPQRARVPLFGMSVVSSTTYRVPPSRWAWCRRRGHRIQGASTASTRCPF